MIEEERAALYRQLMQSRERATRKRYRALAGSLEAYQRRLARTRALMRDDGWDPIEYLTEEKRDALGN